MALIMTQSGEFHDSQRLAYRSYIVSICQEQAARILHPAQQIAIYLTHPTQSTSMNQKSAGGTTLNQPTLDVIEFLTHPDLDFGHSTADVELLGNPELLHQRVHELLENPPTFLTSREEGLKLRAQLGEADWPAVAQEFRTRVAMASRFFGQDAGA